MLSMKTMSLVAGIVVLCFGALLFVDAYFTTFNPLGQVLSANDVKGVVGMALIAIAAFYFIEARSKN